MINNSHRFLLSVTNVKITSGLNNNIDIKIFDNYILKFILFWMTVVMQYRYGLGSFHIKERDDVKQISFHTCAVNSKTKRMLNCCKSEVDSNAR